MKKVLIIADLFHASPRIPALAKYLPQLGWKPIILTGPPPKTLGQELKIIQTPFPDVVTFLKKTLFLDTNKGFQKQIGVPFIIRESKKSPTTKLVNFVKGIIAYPDEHKAWKPFALKAADELFKKEIIDAIISSSSPVTSHVIANELKRKYRIPWIADLRDLWTQNHNYHFGRIRKLFEQRLELKILKTADGLVTVSPLWAEELRILHRRKCVYSITNGFDPDEMNMGQVGLTPKCTITYTGQIYTGKQDLAVFFESLKDLISDGIISIDDVEVRFFGPANEALEQQIKKHELADIAKQYGNLDRKCAFRKQKESHLLLLFNWNDPRIKGWYPLKLFEYLAAQRPILVIGGSGDDVVKKLLYEIKAGIYCKTVEDSRNVLKALYLEYKTKGKIAYNGDIKKINKYSYREKAKQFAKMLDRIKQKD